VFCLWRTFCLETAVIVQRIIKLTKTMLSKIDAHMSHAHTRRTHTHTHTHTVLTALFHVNRGSLLVQCPLISFVPAVCILLIFVTYFAPFHRSTSLCLTIYLCHNHCAACDPKHFVILIMKLTGFSPSDSLISAVFFFLRVYLIWSCSTSLASSHCYTHWTIKTWHFIFDYNFG